MEYLGFSGIVVIAIFIVFILAKRPIEKTDILLIIFNILLGMFVALNSIDPSRLTELTLILQNTLPFFFFPVFVLLILNTTKPKQFSNKWHLLFLPGICFLTMASIRHLSLDFTPQLLMEEYNSPPLYYHFFFKGFQLLILLLLPYLMMQLRVYQNRIKNRFSNLEYIEISWLYNFSIIYLVNTALTMVLFLSSNLQLLPINIQLSFAIINGVLVVSLFYMNYQGIKHYSIAHYQNKIIHNQANTTYIKIEKPQEQKKIDNHKSEGIFKRAQLVMESKLLFLESNLRLKDLATEMGESTHNLSEAINTIGQQSFYDFVNAYRVEHLKKLLSNEENKTFTILALGLDSGFNSKASLNRIFKQSTGLTPLQYQNKSFNPV